jgi:hypothetical protein
MKINEILIESQQLDEGPFTQAVGKVGGKIAKGVAGVGKDLKTGFKAGYSGEEPPASTEPAAKKPGLLQKIGQAAGDFKKGFQQGSGQTTTPGAQASTPAPAANNSNAAAAPATAEPAAPAKVAAPAAKEPAAADNTGADAAAVKKELDSFLATYRKDLAMQNKNWEFVTPKVNALEKQVADLVASGSAATAPAAEPAATVAEPETKRRGGKVAGELSQTPDAVRKRNSRRDKANATATTGGAGAFNQMTQQATQQNAGIERVGNNLAETLAHKVQEQKQRMFETALASGQQSIFKK